MRGLTKLESDNSYTGELKLITFFVCKLFIPIYRNNVRTDKIKYIFYTYALGDNFNTCKLIQVLLEPFFYCFLALELSTGGYPARITQVDPSCQFARKLFMSLLFSKSYEEVTLLFAINAPIMLSLLFCEDEMGWVKE
jgi:hypothetical protein